MMDRTVGHYRIIRKLGAGGMGEVYRAHDEQLDRHVALKVLPAESFCDANARARLLREARTASQLNHPNICTIHEVGEADDQAYIVMELVEGEPLSARLEAGALPVPDVLRNGLQLTEALAHAHGRNVVHRDFKSANIMITLEGRVKVVDFGLAKRLSEGELDEATRSQASLTRPGSIMGTLAYMAPEQLRGQPADARSDVWALGVVLYEMAAGARPFQGQTGFELSSAVLYRRPAPPPGNVPVELRAVIERCLEKEPARRYQRAGEVRAALEAIHAGAVMPWKAWRYRLARRRWLAAAGAVMLLAVAAGLSFERTRMQFFEGAPRIQSLAVLPLENLSGDPEQEYFADGMTESLITDLARLGGLKRVIARGSVMRYKGATKPFAEIAGELKVDALITGAVLRSGNRIRITAQLIDPETEEQLWTERYERDLRDVLALQNEFTRAIAGEIRLKLDPEEHRRLASARPVNPEAHDAYLKGRVHTQKASPEAFETALGYFQLALERDPDYARAYWGIAIVWTLREQLEMVRPSDAKPKAREALLKSLELDPALPEARATLAHNKFFNDWDWAVAETELRDAMELIPGYAGPLIWYAELLAATGRAEEAVPVMRRALELDPYNSLYQVFFAEALVRARHDDEALGFLQQLLRTDPDMNMAHELLQTIFEKKQMYREALAEAKQLAAARGDSEMTDALDRGYAQGGYPQAMRLAADLAVRRSRRTYVAPTVIVDFYGAAGERELAVEWLEKAYQERQSALVHLQSSRRWETLRDHPRFQALLKKMNFPP